LLNPNDIGEKLMKAELYRNLGEFEKCIEQIDSIDENDKHYTQIKNKMKDMATKKYSLVYLMNKPFENQYE
jgi:gamma-glutamylcyclotransferase (GGCT)/AIG2-like uncharacterized protein YtfP